MSRYAVYLAIVSAATLAAVFCKDLWAWIS